jgi:hypothetical protein
MSSAMHSYQVCLPCLSVTLELSNRPQVFLRVLEFYTGVLFLTTNRVGALDEAIRARITWISYYPPLNLEQSSEIWKTNIERVAKNNPNLEIDAEGILKFARRHFKKGTKAGNMWNGRKIQMAFKAATALAHWDACSEEEQDQAELPGSPAEGTRSAKLTAEHFKRYAEDAAAFDEYNQQAMGVTDAEAAFNKQERDDTWAQQQRARDAATAAQQQQQQQYLSPTSPSDAYGGTPIINQTGRERRPSSPMHRPQVMARHSTTQLPEHLHTQTYPQYGGSAGYQQVPLARQRSREMGNSPMMRPVPNVRPRGDSYQSAWDPRVHPGRPRSQDSEEDAYQPLEDSDLSSNGGR